MKTFGILLMTLLLFSSVETYGQTTDQKNMSNDTLTWKATVVKIPFVNKRGKTVEGMADLFLRKEDKNYFIKFLGGNLLRTEVEKYVDKEITVELSLRKGNLDTDDSNHMQQSRVGEYVVLFSIME